MRVLIKQKSAHKILHLHNWNVN